MPKSKSKTTLNPPSRKKDALIEQQLESPKQPSKSQYRMYKLIANCPSSRYKYDPQLNDPYGLTITGSHLWVANHGNTIITHYNLLGEHAIPHIVQMALNLDKCSIPIQRKLVYDLLQFINQTNSCQLPLPSATTNDRVKWEDYAPFLQGTSLGTHWELVLKFLVEHYDADLPTSIHNDCTQLSTILDSHSVANNTDLTSLQPIIETIAGKIIQPPPTPLINNILIGGEPAQAPKSPIITLQMSNQALARLSGLVHNDTKGFVITQSGSSMSSLLIGVTENGGIYAYNPSISLSCVLMVDNSLAKSFYKGATIANNTLYVADFFNRRIDVFDFNFKPVNGYTFSDPNLPSDYAPINIQCLPHKNQLYVLYAKRDPTNPYVPVKEYCNGFISVFNVNGGFIRRFVSQGVLNVPCCLLLAPSRFGLGQDSLLVGNYGDGRINIYDLTGLYKGTLLNRHGQPIVIEGLRSIATTDRCLYWSAQPNQDSASWIGQIKCLV